MRSTKTAGLGSVVGRLRALRPPSTAAPADAELLDRFVQSNNAAAFDLLLQRHGPMVLGVCRRLLRNHADAEDAFQATFLVLVRKAAGIRPRSMVGNWLYGVAHRAALKALAMNQTRRTKERRAVELEQARGPQDQAHLAELLDAELSKLPDAYRVAIVLCELEGRPIREAAGVLGWPAGTVASRLWRGKRILAQRLRRLGYPASAGVALGVLSSAGAAPLPALLSAATREAASLLAGGGQVIAEAGSTKAMILAEALMKTMLLEKLRHVLGGLLLGLVCASVALLLPWVHGQEATQPAPRNEAARQTAEAAPTAGLRKILETLEWRLTEVDPLKSTIGLNDHLPGGQPGAMVIIATKSGAGAATGLTLNAVGVAADAQIVFDGKPAKLADLKQGLRVRLTISARGDTVAKINATSPPPPVFTYLLKGVDAKARTITVSLLEKKLDFDNVPLAPDVEIKRLEINPAARFGDITLADLQPGMYLSLQIAGDQDGRLRVTSIWATKP